MTVRPAARLLLRAMFLAHRYLGIGLGLLMLVWCLSGIVMMYVPYPALKQSIRLSALAPIDWSACCTFPQDFRSGNAADFQLEMLGRDPVLRLLPDGRGKPTTLIDLRTGREFVGISAGQARAAAAAFGRSQAFRGEPIDLGSVVHDQWSVEGSFRKDAPLLRFTWPDARKPVLYLSSHTGAAVQLTTASQRFWNWLGAIPHWIYFTSLRERPQLWTEVVVWISALGTFLTLIGLYLGVLQYWRMRGRGRSSPYRGFLYWHHVPGLIFGLFTLTWVASGLISMNPWGFLDEDVPPADLKLLHGEPIDRDQLVRALDSLKSAASLKSDTPDFPAVSVRSAGLGGVPKLLLLGSDGKRSRVDVSGSPSSLTREELAAGTSALSSGSVPPAPELLRSGDGYYFPHHNYDLVLPVYRIVADDADHTRYYFDAVSGALLARFGARAREYRWLHEGLHRLDFVQSRPAWDALMLTLLSGVTVICATGAYLGIRRLLLHPVRGSDSNAADA